MSKPKVFTAKFSAYGLEVSSPGDKLGCPLILFREAQSMTTGHRVQEAREHISESELPIDSLTRRALDVEFDKQIKLALGRLREIVEGLEGECSTGESPP